jgi:adenylate kinase family enzyme
VIGSAGSGKSTLSRDLARRLNRPLVRLDDIYWESRWLRPDPEAFRSRLMEALAQPSWIIDGGYIDSLPERLPFADAVVYLDLAAPVCAARFAWRTFKHHVGLSDDRPRAIREAAARSGRRVSLRFPTRSRFLIKITRILTFRRRVRPRILAMLEDCRDRIPVIVLTDRAAVDALVGGATPSRTRNASLAPS